MKVNTLRTSSTLTFWWDKPDTQISEYIYYLDGMETGRTEKTHFTLSSLESSREYKIRITAEGIDETIVATTDRKRKRINIAEAPYCAVGDGKTLNTEKIQKAFDDADENTEIYIPEGIFLTGALRMHSNSALYIEKDGVLQGTADPSDYNPRIHSRFEGIEME